MITKYTKGMVYWAKLPSYEENPNVQWGMRPVIIVSNDVGNFFSSNVTIVPCTTNTEDKENQPTHIITVLNNKDKSVVLCENIMTIHKNLLQTFMGVLDNNTMSKIDKCLMVALGLVEIPNNSINYDEPKQKPLEETRKVNRGRKVQGKSEMLKFLEFTKTHTKEETAAEYGIPTTVAVGTRIRYYKKKLKIK